MVVQEEYMINHRSSAYPIEIKKSNDFCVVKPHSHKEVSLGLIKYGTTRVIIDGEEFILNKGDLIFIPPDRVHLCVPDNKNNFCFIMFYIESNWLSSLLDIDIKRLRPYSASTGSYGISLITDSRDEKSAVISLIKNYIKFAEYQVVGNKELSRIKNYIDLNYCNELSLNDLVLKFGINKFILIRKFKKLYNLSPRSYIINLRINKAKEMLTSNNDLTNIAHECGFYDLSHFIKTFKHYTGLTPDSYR